MLASASTTSFTGARVVSKTTARRAKRAVAARAGQYDDELLETAQNMTMPGKGILAMDESNATCGTRLEGVGVENTEENRRRYRELLITTKGMGEYVGGAILFEETLYQSCSDGTSFVDALREQGIYPGIKVDKGLRPLANSNGESWCQGLDGLADRAAEYYKQGARFCKWRSVVSIPSGPSKIAVTDCAYGLARYAAICQNAGFVPIVEPEILLDGEHTLEETYEVASAVWAETFKYLADNNVMFDRMLLKPSMVGPGADCAKRNTPEEVAEATLKMLNSRVPPATAGIMFLSGGLSELDSTLYLNAMNQQPNPWHVSFRTRERCKTPSSRRGLATTPWLARRKPSCPDVRKKTVSRNSASSTRMNLWLTPTPPSKRTTCTNRLLVY